MISATWPCVLGWLWSLFDQPRFVSVQRHRLHYFRDITVLCLTPCCTFLRGLSPFAVEIAITFFTPFNSASDTGIMT
jgi:hypothetical protein